jgi:pimeloyl-ACP methyl ester carboxylesterase
MNAQYLKRINADSLAYVHTPATAAGAHSPLVMFMGGYRSDMSGTKATYFENQCRARGQAYLRFDYSGHGLSDGQFEDGTISQWTEDALAVLDHIAPKRVVLVGSSMGGWIALLMALARPNFVHGLVGIAAAPDFTEELYERLDATAKSQLENKGVVAIGNNYGAEPYAFTKKIHDDGKKRLLLNASHKINFPVVLVQGKMDKDVPWETAIRIQQSLQGAKVNILYIEDGEHRLSRTQDLELIDSQIQAICA